VLMSDVTVAIDVRVIDASISVIDIGGSVTRMAEQPLTEAYRAASGPQTGTIVLNFARLEYMNSSGIGLLVTLFVRAKRQGQKVFVCELSEHYQEIFSLTRLDEAMQIFPHEEQALTAARAQ